MKSATATLATCLMLAPLSLAAAEVGAQAGAKLDASGAAQTTDSALAAGSQAAARTEAELKAGARKAEQERKHGGDGTSGSLRLGADAKTSGEASSGNASGDTQIKAQGDARAEDDDE